MATRQELFTAIGLIRRTCRMNGHVNGLVLNLKGLGDYSEPEEPDGLKPFDRQKKACQVPCNIIYDVSGKIGMFLERVDSNYLDTGIDAIPVPATRLKINSDVSNLKILSTNLKGLLGVVTEKNGLALLSPQIESYISECGIDEPDPWKLFSKEINHLNILHGILDAMSYELQGKNSYTGEDHTLTDGQFNKLIVNRLFTANVYLSHLPQSVDKQNMTNVKSYIQQNFEPGLKTVGLKKLGQYIDSNIPKQIIVRRWWAL